MNRPNPYDLQVHEDEKLVYATLTRDGMVAYSSRHFPAERQPDAPNPVERALESLVLIMADAIAELKAEAAHLHERHEVDLRINHEMSNENGVLSGENARAWALARRLKDDLADANARADRLTELVNEPAPDSAPAVKPSPPSDDPRRQARIAMDNAMRYAGEPNIVKAEMWANIAKAWMALEAMGTNTT
jgi:hypothetical protein